MEELNATVKLTMEYPIPKAAIQSAYIHKNMVKEMVTWDYENIKILDLVKRIEERIVLEVQAISPHQPQLNGGIAFPVGIGINHCVAHYTPLTGNQVTIRAGDLVKIDFGVQIDGEITDSAFTIGVNTQDFDPLIDISRKATMIGVKASGPDKLLSEIGEEIEEYVTSKEILLPNTSETPIPLKVMRELCGHSIAPYTIHAGKAVPNCKIDFEYPLRMRPGEKYAIEPFVTTGNGLNINGSEKSHYMIKPGKSHKSHKSTFLGQGPKVRDAHRDPEGRRDISEGGSSSIMEKYGTLPFNRRWLAESLSHRDIVDSTLDQMVKSGILEEYPPIYDVEGSYVAQTEHNVWIGEKRAYQLT